MILKRFAFVAVILAACASIAGAQCVVRHRAAVVQQAVVTPVAVAPVVAAYGAAYDDQAATQNLIRDLTKRIADLEARVAVVETARDNLAQRLNAAEAKIGIQPPPQMPKADEPKPRKEEKPSPAPAAQQAKTSLPALVARSCVQCHSAAKASGGLELVDARGQLTNLAADLKLEVLRRINLPADDPKVMPPQKDKLPADVKKLATDEEAAEMLDRLTERRK